jgi:hypothetical protein
MNCQSKPAKSFRNNCEHAFGVMLVLKADDEVICIADEKGTATYPRFHILFEPEIQHIVQEYVRKDGGNRSSNDIANNCGMLDRIVPRTQLQTAYGEGWKKP